MEKTDYLIREWINIYHAQPSARDSTKAFSMFVHQMNVHGILKTDDLITRFFRLSTQLCVETVYRNLQEQSLTSTVLRAKCYHTLDAFVRLVALLVKHSGDTSNTTTKIHLLNKVCFCTILAFYLPAVSTVLFLGARYSGRLPATRP